MVNDEIIEEKSLVRMHKNVLLYFLALILISCGDAKEFEKYQSVKNSAWHKDSIINFKYNPKDTISRNNVYINLRNNKDYEYSNLFLIVGIEFPDNTTIVDTLEYEMTDAQGNFLGSGLTDLKENKLEYKADVIFPKSGDYTINVQHAMRKSGQIDGISNLEGISEVGVSIEKTKTNE